MKKIILFIMGVAFSHSLAFAQACLPDSASAQVRQGCLPEGITFTTQAEVDSFPVNYPGCTIIEGNLTIYGSWDITSLNGLSSLISVGGDLTINDSHSLPDFTGLGNLQTVGGNVLIKNNINQLSYGGLENLTTIGGNFNTYQYYNTTLTNFQGLNSLTSIGGYFFVSIFSVLNDFSGLENLVSIGSDFNVYGITAHSFSGLDNLATVGGFVSISGIPDLESFSGLLGLSSVGSHLYLFSLPEIRNLNGLNNLTYVGGTIDIYGNDSLTSLNGIDNIASGTIDNISIHGNYSLSTCEVRSVCNYLAAPAGAVYITDNAPGCNSPEEVIEACLAPVEEPDTGTSYTIIPNPSNNEITVSLPAITGITRLTIFTVNGQKAMERQLTDNETHLDISALPRGVYLVKVEDERTVMVGKFVK